ncbi:MAG TPA: ATP synthase F0 subunit B [Terriglobia bacterium]|nr:ATP synthase F0 subunit B [Terriglobia bacterium]
METLVALGDILLKSIPTFLLVWILYFYTGRFFLQPLRQTLQRRHDATEGLRQTAAERLRLAEQKTAEYQEAMRSHAADLYRQQEQDRQRALEKRAEILRLARAQAEQRLAAARQQIQRDAEEAKRVLERESEALAAGIVRAVLGASSRGRLAAEQAPGRIP